MNAYALNNLSASMWEGKPNPCRFLSSLLAIGHVALTDVIALIIFSSFAMHPDYATTFTL